MLSLCLRKPVSVRARQRQLARRSGGRRAQAKCLAMLPMEFDAGSVVGSIDQDAIVTVHDGLGPGRVERHYLEVSTRYIGMRLIDYQ